MMMDLDQHTRVVVDDIGFAVVVEGDTAKVMYVGHVES